MGLHLCDWCKITYKAKCVICSVRAARRRKICTKIIMPRDNSLEKKQRFAVVCLMMWTGTEEHSRVLFLQPLWKVLRTRKTRGTLLLYKLPSKGSGLLSSCPAPNLCSQVKPKLVLPNWNCFVIPWFHLRKEEDTPGKEPPGGTDAAESPIFRVHTF